MNREEEIYLKGWADGKKEIKEILTKSSKKNYWLDELDRFGLLFAGIFIGALAELTGIRTLGIIIGVAGLTCIGILMLVIKRYAKTTDIKDKQEVKE